MEELEEVGGGKSLSFVVCLVVVLSSGLDKDANLGALFASSWTKQRFAVRCHAALASAAAITPPYSFQASTTYNIFSSIL